MIILRLGHRTNPAGLNRPDIAGTGSPPLARVRTGQNTEAFFGPGEQVHRAARSPWRCRDAHPVPARNPGLPGARLTFRCRSAHAAASSRRIVIPDTADASHDNVRVMIDWQALAQRTYCALRR